MGGFMRAASMGAVVTGVLVVLIAGCGGGSEDGSGGGRTAKKSAAAKDSASAVGTARLTSGDLQGRWWTWATSEPEATNPVADPDGGACAANQADDVWFLAGTFGDRVERSCPLPAGVPVAFPLVNLIATEEDCAAFMSAAEGSAVLDGEAVEAERYPGEPITVTSAADNPVTAEAGTFTATGCGLWVQLPALDPGTHTLQIRGESGDFFTGVDYSLAVAKR